MRRQGEGVVLEEAVLLLPSKTDRRSWLTLYTSLVWKQLAFVTSLLKKSNT